MDASLAAARTSLLAGERPVRDSAGSGVREEVGKVWMETPRVVVVDGHLPTTFFFFSSSG
jgi:hypothetical protein